MSHFEADVYSNRGGALKYVLIAIALILLIVFRKSIASKFEILKDKIKNENETIEKPLKEEHGGFSAEIAFGEEDYGKIIPIESVYASSVLISNKGINYGAENMFDGNVETSWQEGEKDAGEGAIIVLSFEKEVPVEYILVNNGNQKSEDSYKKNNRLKDIKITINRQNATVRLDDSMEPQVIKLTGASDVKEICIEINSVYEGTEYNDTCVSEISCY